MKTFLSLCSIIIILFSNNLLKAQTETEWYDSSQVFPLTKMYLHTDRDYYFKDEDVWFKAYLIDGVTHKRLGGNQNLYLDLIDADGSIILSKMYLIIDGLAAGDFKIPQNITPGNYLVRAYTDYSIKLDNSGIFYKALTIAEIEDFIGEDNFENASKKKFGELHLLPEGGFMLTGEQNVVAFTILDSNGLAFDGELKIIDELGNPIVQTKTIFKGKGKFIFVPEKGKKYYAEINEQPEYHKEITHIQDKGSKIQLSSFKSDTLTIDLISKSDTERNFYLACLNRGNLLFYKKINTENNYAKVKIESNVLKAGINKVLLLNDHFQPLSERLVFSNNYDVNRIGIENLNETYTTREKVAPHLVNNFAAKNNIYSNLSVAIVSEATLNKKNTNILSWSMLDSELQNFNESSLEYFTDDKSISSMVKLDLLMLTCGWSNYLWNKTTDIKKEDRTFTSGITIQGYSKKLLRNKPVPFSEIVMQVFAKNDIKFYSQMPDSTGRFVFKNIYFEDTAKVLVQSKNKKRKNIGELLLLPVNFEKPSMSLKQLTRLKSNFSLTPQLYKQKYSIESEKRAFYPDYETIMLDDVEVQGVNEKERKEEFVTLYGDPDRSFKVTELDETFTNVLDYIASNVPSVTVYNNYLTIRGSSTFSGDASPLFLIDGMYFEGRDGFDMAMSLNMHEISSVDILTSPSNLALFGSRGGSGVIAIYTKKGTPFQHEKAFIKGSIEKTISGFEPFREFYSPEYGEENINSNEPDGRLTLYWNPEVLIDEGSADISFFTSDQSGTYKVIIEGISSDGKICLGTGEFKVSDSNLQ